MSTDLKNILNSTGLNRKDRILILLKHNDSKAKQVNEIKELAKKNGLREIDKWNVSMILSSLKGFAIKLPEGWAVTREGEKHLAKIGYLDFSPVIKTHTNLLNKAESISSPYVKEFVIEAIKSLEFRLYKSAVVFSWIGAISLLYEYIVNNSLVAFNNEAKRRDYRWKAAKKVDGLTKMKEYDFLQIIESISLIGKNTKNELEQCLKLRNSCGHPSTLKIGENKVASHLEILILNVYNVFI